MEKPLIMGLVVLLLMLLYPGQSQDAFACQCNSQLPLTKFEKADAVFTGKVTDLAYISQTGYVILEVDMIWKGVSDDSVTVFEDTTKGCASGFRTGQNYIVYATMASGTFGEPVLGTHACQGTHNTVLESTFDELEVLGAGYLPTNEAGALSRSSFYLTWFLATPIAMAAAASAAGVAGFIFLRRRKAKTQHSG